MSSSIALGSEPAMAARNRLIMVVYTATIFVSALLLFSVQPMFTKLVLPRLGGSPAVWSVAMVFFQSLLLAGYAYAHLLMHVRNRFVVVSVHLAVLLAAMLTLPISIAVGWGNPPESGYALWLLGLFTVSIGLPFFALSANSPLLQAWFVQTGHPNGPDPYFLYASSNIGSFLALLSYPLLIEPILSLQMQTLSWTWGYGILIVLIGLCGFLLLRSPAAVAARPAALVEHAPKPGWARWLRWIFLSAVPSGLLIAVTAHISTDVAAAPLLWVLPLSLYLLTWVLVFQSKPLVPHRLLVLLLPIAVADVILLLLVGNATNFLLTLGAHLLCFFLITMACHGELARLRPPAKYLTSFYLALSFGGMVGGMFAGLLAPLMFSWIAEYPILIALAVLCLPVATERFPLWGRWYWPVLAVVAMLLVVPVLVPGAMLEWLSTRRVLVVGLLTIAAVVFAVALRADRLKLFALIALALVLLRLYPADGGSVETVRSFFGIHKIVAVDDGRYHVLMHGTTAHGAQQMLNADGSPITGRPEPLTYYSRDGGMAQAIRAMRAAKGGPLRVAVIGLGTGSLACTAEPGETWKFFEIDQAIVDLARNPKYFNFIDKCMPDMAPVIGDARLTFADEPDGAYDVIVVDAYSSDAIPVHLATVEAMAIYKKKLAPHGAVVMHVTNRHLDLANVAEGIAGANGLTSWVDVHISPRIEEFIYSSIVVVSARSAEDVGEIASSNAWVLTSAEPGQGVWTDDYSNVLGALWRRLMHPVQDAVPSPSPFDASP